MPSLCPPRQHGGAGWPEQCFVVACHHLEERYGKRMENISLICSLQETLASHIQTGSRSAISTDPRLLGAGVDAFSSLPAQIQAQVGGGSPNPGMCPRFQKPRAVPQPPAALQRSGTLIPRAVRDTAGVGQIKCSKYLRDCSYSELIDPGQIKDSLCLIKEIFVSSQMKFRAPGF